MKGERYPLTYAGVQSVLAAACAGRRASPACAFTTLRHDFASKLLRATGNLTAGAEGPRASRHQDNDTICART